MIITPDYKKSTNIDEIIIIIDGVFRVYHSSQKLAERQEEIIKKLQERDQS